MTVTAHTPLWAMGDADKKRRRRRRPLLFVEREGGSMARDATSVPSTCHCRKMVRPTDATKISCQIKTNQLGGEIAQSEADGPPSGVNSSCRVLSPSLSLPLPLSNPLLALNLNPGPSFFFLPCFCTLRNFLAVVALPVPPYKIFFSPVVVIALIISRSCSCVLRREKRNEVLTSLDAKWPTCVSTIPCIVASKKACLPACRLQRLQHNRNV